MARLSSGGGSLQTLVCLGDCARFLLPVVVSDGRLIPDQQQYPGRKVAPLMIEVLGA